MKKQTYSVENTQDSSTLYFLSFPLAWKHYQELLQKNIPAKLKENNETMFECSFEDIFGLVS